MECVFWNYKGIILIESLAEVETVNAAIYYENLTKLKKANYWKRMLTKGVCLLHNKVAFSQSVLRHYMRSLLRTPYLI